MTAPQPTFLDDESAFPAAHAAADGSIDALGRDGSAPVLLADDALLVFPEVVADALGSGTADDAAAAAAVRAHHTIALLVDVGSGGLAGSHPGSADIGDSHGVVSVHNELQTGGPGHDRLIGDAEHRGVEGDTTLLVEAGTGGADGGGAGGIGNLLHGMGDILAAEGGNDLLVGDVLLASDAGTAALVAAAGIGGLGGSQEGGDGGSDNRVFAFNDRLAGGDGNDTLVGEVVSDHTTGSIDLVAAAGQGGGGDGTGGHGGDNNWVGAFNDRLDGGDGDDRLIGDLSVAAFAAGPQGEIRLMVASGAAGSYSADDGGSGNVVRAFGDTLDGGDGNDLLIGDLRYLFDNAHDGDLLVLDIQGGKGDRANVFCDRLSGGAGNDTIIGDCYDGHASFSPQVWSQPESGKLFADTIDGGDGNDVIVGGLGADVMAGGAGDDVFRWDLDDLWESPVPGVDRIQDFAAGDVLDLRPFFSAFAFDPGHEPDASFLRLTQDGGDTVIAYSLTGGPLYENFVRLESFTTDQSAQDLIDHGTILIA